jgi:hypothetical protein
MPLGWILQAHGVTLAYHFSLDLIRPQERVATSVSSLEKLARVLEQICVSFCSFIIHCVPTESTGAKNQKRLIFSGDQSVAIALPLRLA